MATKGHYIVSGVLSFPEAANMQLEKAKVLGYLGSIKDKIQHIYTTSDDGVDSFVREFAAVNNLPITITKKESTGKYTATSYLISLVHQKEPFEVILFRLPNKYQGDKDFKSLVILNQTSHHTDKHLTVKVMM